MQDTTRKIDVVTDTELVDSTRDALQRIIDVTQRWQGNALVTNGAVASRLDEALARIEGRGGLRGTVIDLIRDAAERADRDAGSAPNITVLLTCQLALYAMQNIAAGDHSLNVGRDLMNIHELRNSLSSYMRRPTLGEVYSVIDTNVSNENYREMIREALKLTGVDGRIFFEMAKIPLPELELRIGYTFNSLQPIMATVGQDNWHAYDARVVCIDGMCETPAELDNILTMANETREPVCIFARQFNEDVLRTIAVNNRRGTINVMPIVVPFDADSANVLKDVAVVAGGDVTSSFEGRLISTIVFDELSTVSEVKCVDGCVTLIEDKTRDHVDAHVDGLRASMEGNELATPFLMRRVRALTSRTTFIRMFEYDLVGAADVDRTLRCVKSAMRFGVITKSKLADTIKKFDREGLQGALTTWLEHLPDELVLPLRALDAMLVNAETTARLIATTGAVLT